MHKVNDWQEMSLKKDVETIARELKSNNEIEIPLIIDILLTLVSTIIDNMIKCDRVVRIIIFLLSIFIIIISIYIMIKLLHSYFLKRHDIKRAKFKIKPYIDIFDNNICYYAVTANTFFENYLELREKGIKDENERSLSLKLENSELETFYFIETHYYINKCISEFDKMRNIIEDIFTDSSNDVVCKRKIHISRLKNILSMLIEIKSQLDNEIVTEKNKDTVNVTNEYSKTMVEFISILNKAFSLNIEWPQKKKCE